MNNFKYDELKRKYDVLLEENKRLKAKINELTDKPRSNISHHKPVQASETLFIQTDIETLNQQSYAEINNTTSNNNGFITKYSQNHEKIALFMSLFKSRTDVYAKKWHTKKGYSGYSPVCLNEWKPGLCHKPREKCSNCKNQAYEALSDSIIEKHLKGEYIIGIYPMQSDETCHFLAVDFDNEGWEKDVEVIRDICAEMNIPIAVERSQSGNGCHVWFFFKQNLSASLARKFGTSLLTYGMSKRYVISFKSYDRLFPNQDTMPKGGFGNLIALPLQKMARDNNNSVFVDENFMPYADQWQFLAGVQRLTKKDLTSIITRLNQENDLGILKADASETKPWKKQSIVLGRQDFPKTVTIIKSGMLYIKKKGWSQKALNTVKRFAAFQNPEFYKAQAMRLSTFGKPRVISCSDDFENHLALPRGCEADIKSLLMENDVTVAMEDESNPGKVIKVEFNGVLREEQEEAYNALTGHENGVLSAAPAFGKTVIAAKLISSKKVNTLILVHRRQLLSQWREKLGEFLIINELLPEQPKSRGRKKEWQLIGHMAAGKDRFSSIIDVAVMQSLYTKGTVKDAIKNYGMIIVDECHHVPAVTFEQILKQATAKYIYGMTATPDRSDGHHPIIFFYCGPVRFSADSKKQAKKRPFDHYLVPRFTSFKTTSDGKEETLSLQTIKSRMISDEIRNQRILDDVVECYNKGRKCLILTSRTAHVETLGKKLNKNLSNIICLTGGMSAKKTARVMEQINAIKPADPFVLVATGSYIGEGFDEARLDTLFLAMPISWKGTLQQYAGRLHRFHEDKTDVQIYDYVDLYVNMLEKMYGKRLKGYASIGYQVKASPFPDAPTNIIFNKDSFFPVYMRDITAASKHILIVSPFVTQKRIEQMIGHFSELMKKQVEITMITRPAGDFQKERRSRLKLLFSNIESSGIRLVLKSKIHQKFAVIDHQITWYGSINLLSFGFSEESIMRLESSSIACELEESVQVEPDS